MTQSSAFITLKRNKTSSNQLRQFAITVDNKVVGKIQAGQVKQFRLSCGKHAIGIKLDFYKSEQLQIDLNTDDNIHLECGDRAPETIREAFTFKGLEKSINSIIKPSQYLYVKMTGKQSPSPLKKEKTTEKITSPSKAKSMGSIFISYRRDDSREITGRICDRLNNEYGKETIFRDVDSIPAGVDYRNHISKTIEGCSAFLIVIGAQWIEAKNNAGQRRLELDSDPVKVEIEMALKKEIPIIPVLVKNGVMPDEAQLPESIKPLAFRNAIPIPAEPYFHAGVDRLITELNQTLSPGPEKRTQSVKYCIYCGEAIIPGNKFCIQCGKAI
ncbi:MAG: TIR domain-containing protein [Sedimenticola sp.]|uniref:TIR domain-containing protein n=1 Tax=Sedimenticola thiotaurini TaxID=1543721 RepID=A0A558DFM2_9GAMM|nr:TIR domain-containing protein [Sedimenticola sp.]TVT59835.1 MAG: TIR domain-containing protein [Sedimenticola thiotaurini]MCW8920247.1 TIR domain-containing protein [Sedimenticola sp.]MCW8947836.1 TIR domain-containing protein [Sedimenticola sp.]MCW8948776.1 TIR domain-containing protein [Sedimenticola sp.]